MIYAALRAAMIYQACGLDKKNSESFCFRSFLEAPPGIGPGIKVLQTSALPLGYGAVFRNGNIIPRTSFFVNPFFEIL